MEQINQIYTFLNTAQNSLLVLLAFLGVALLALVLRVIVCVNYQTQLALFQLYAKEIKSKADIKDTRSPFLNRVIKDYLRIGDKGVSPRSARSVVDKHIARLNFLGWSYDGMGGFAAAVERNIVFLGIILTFVFEEYKYVFAICTVAAFLILRLFGAFFDFAVAKQKLAMEVSEYVEREIGQFYAGDSNSLILRLKNELAAAILKQSENLGDAVQKMGSDISGVLRLSVQEMSKSVDSTMSRVSDFGGELSAPLEKWRAAINDAASTQAKFATAFESFNGVSKSFTAAGTGLAKEINGYNESIKKQTSAVNAQISELKEVSAGLKETTKPLLTLQTAIEPQLKLVEQNQEALEKSLQRYELAMEDMTRKLGDGMGSIVEFHMQNAYSELNSGLEDSIKRVANANNELILRLEQLFEQIYEQSRSESQAIMKVKEQMDIHFENLKTKL